MEKRPFHFSTLMVSISALFVAATFTRLGVTDDRPTMVKLSRVPNGGVQPQVVSDGSGTVHMIYYHGKADAGDVYYVRSNDAGKTFSNPLRVNSQDYSAIAAGTIRGAQLALGKDDRIHVAWNGSGRATPKGLANPQLPEDSPYRHSSPMLYSRMNAEGSDFEPQRNLMTHTYALDGGGSVAADPAGNVYVVWHANSVKDKSRGEGGRAVWVATSRDGGTTFAPELRVNRDPTGACGCCGLKAQSDSRGGIYILYRSAQETIHRDMYALISKDNGVNFMPTKLDDWKIGSCMMSSAALHCTTDGTLAAWETKRQVKFARLNDPAAYSRERPMIPHPSTTTRKHPVLTSNGKGQVILVWTEGTGWQKGGAVAWQVFDKSGAKVASGSGREDGVPVWSVAAVYSRPDGGFTIVY